MENEDFDSIYEEELKSAEKEFLEGIKNKQNISELEKTYKEKLFKSREKYYSSISKDLKKPKQVTKKKKPKEKKTEPFKVKAADRGLSFSQKLKIKLKILAFRTHFKARNAFREKTPEPALYQYIKIKLTTKRIYRNIKNSVIKTWKSLKDSIINLLVKTKDKLKDMSKRISSKTKTITEKLIAKFTRKKKEGEEPSEAKKPSDQEKTNSDQNK